MINYGKKNHVFDKIIKEKTARAKESEENRKMRKGNKDEQIKVREIEIIEECKKEEFICSLNDIYIKLKKQKNDCIVDELNMFKDEERCFIHSHGIKELIGETIYRLEDYEENTLAKKISKLVEGKDPDGISQFDENYNCNYKMTMTIYYRLCCFLEYKRIELANLLLNELSIESRLRVEKKIFKIIMREYNISNKVEKNRK